ncbi:MULTISPECIES: GtrA family protein [Rhodobacterales]|uniref:GtrA family protein n=1 Tax=Rhodobacterales TaxID=204455 RepID=UPI0032988289
MKRLRTEASRFTKYGVIGLVNNAVLYAVFVLLVYLGISPVIVAGICYVLGVSASYVLNRRWAFESTNSHARDLPRFLTAYGTGLLSTLATIYVLILWLPPEIAQLLNIAITAVVIYTMLRLLRFGSDASDHAH